MSLLCGKFYCVLFRNHYPWSGSIQEGFASWHSTYTCTTQRRTHASRTLVVVRYPGWCIPRDSGITHPVLRRIIQNHMHCNFSRHMHRAFLYWMDVWMTVPVNCMACKRGSGSLDAIIFDLDPPVTFLIKKPIECSLSQQNNPVGVNSIFIGKNVIIKFYVLV